jgi:hypothetical protein
MPYRFDLRGTQVECDSHQELIAALGSDATPTTPTRRAKRSRKHKPRGNQSHSWDVAKFYTSMRGVTLSVTEARGALASDPKLKAKVEKKFAAAQG